MKTITRFKFSFFLLLLCSQALLMTPNRAEAMFAACSWYNAGGTPWIFSYFEYSSWDVGSNNALEVHTQLTSPFSAAALDYFGLSMMGGYQGHEMPASVGPVYSFMAEGTLGFLMEGMFYPSWGAGCFGSFEFLPPSASIVISPSVATVGDSVTITWGSNNAVACYFDNAPIALSGVHTFAAALSDARAYTLECQNPWGWASDTATLVVNEPEPNCPSAVPNPPSSYTYPTPGYVDPGPSRFGQFTVDQYPNVNYTAFCDGSVWRLRLVDLVIPTKMGAHFPGTTQNVTAGLVQQQTSCMNVNNMKDSLNYHSDFTTGVRDIVTYPYFMLPAIEAHEEVHFTQFQSNLNASFVQVRAMFHSVTIPIGDAMDQFEAADMMASIVDTLRDMLYFAESGSSPFFDGMLESAVNADHPPVPWSLFNAASRQVTDLMISDHIDPKLVSLGCS